MQIVIPERGMEQLQPGLQTAMPHADLRVVKPDGTGADVSQAEIFVLWGINAEGQERVLSQASRLRWVHTASAGVDHVATHVLQQRQIILTNSSGVHATPIAEWVMAAILAGAKRLRELSCAQQERRWSQAELRLSELAGKTLLILGLGDIGQAIARRAAAFDMRVWGTRRRGGPVPGVQRLLAPHNWRSALPDADYLVVSLPLTTETRRLIGAAELRSLKPGAWVVNIARGEIIDESALIAVLKEGHLGGAALDVFEQEPLPVDSPLWAMDQVIVSPHLSWSAPGLGRRTAELFLENLRRYAHGEKLLNVVDLHAGY